MPCRERQQIEIKIFAEESSVKYYIQAGAYGTKENADVMVKVLKKKRIFIKYPQSIRLRPIPCPGRHLQNKEGCQQSGEEAEGSRFHCTGEEPVMSNAVVLSRTIKLDR